MKSGSFSDVIHVIACGLPLSRVDLVDDITRCSSRLSSPDMAERGCTVKEAKVLLFLFTSVAFSRLTYTQL